MVVAASFVGAGNDTGLRPQQLLCSRRENGLEVRALLFPGNDADLNVSETAFFQELMQLHFAESEPVICIQFASAFESVTQKIENHQSTAAFQNPTGCGDGSLGMNGVMQGLTENRKIDTVFCDRWIFNIPKPVLEILESMLLRKLGAELDHFWRIIDRDHLARLLRQQLRECPLACSKVSHGQRREQE